jgi:hypothetical protein
MNGTRQLASAVHALGFVLLVGVLVAIGGFGVSSLFELVNDVEVSDQVVLDAVTRL